MISVMVSKWVGDALGRDGIYAAWIALRRYPWLAPVAHRDGGRTAARAMVPASRLVVLRSGVHTLAELGASFVCTRMVLRGG